MKLILLCLIALAIAVDSQSAADHQVLNCAFDATRNYCQYTPLQLPPATTLTATGLTTYITTGNGLLLRSPPFVTLSDAAPVASRWRRKSWAPPSALFGTRNSDRKVHGQAAATVARGRLDGRRAADYQERARSSQRRPIATSAVTCLTRAPRREWTRADLRSHLTQPGHSRSSRHRGYRCKDHRARESSSVTRAAWTRRPPFALNSKASRRAIVSGRSTRKCTLVVRADDVAGCPDRRLENHSRIPGRHRADHQERAHRRQTCDERSIPYHDELDMERDKERSEGTRTTRSAAISGNRVLCRVASTQEV
ncbi:hypothetical protein U1Q18_052299 [Sarracenia purpurea var. burkii]